MPLTKQQIQTLEKVIREYDYPKVTFDFSNQVERKYPKMQDVEKTIRDSLTSKNESDLKDGLSNVLYWGYATQGRRTNRIQEFREKITSQNLQATIGAIEAILKNPGEPGLISIKKLELPEFRYMSFVSKLRMFLDPENFVVLDRQLMKLKVEAPQTLFARIKEEKTHIPITQKNEAHYQRWCNLCAKAARNYFGTQNLRAVDVERGIFWLADQGKKDATKIEDAAGIVTILEHEYSGEKT